MITPAQIKAARAMLDWKQTDLAAAAGLSEMSVKNVEKGQKDSRMSTIQSIRSALESAGIIFIDQNGNGPGVRLRDRQI
ncbi:helix-turn-helix domain-containing protein [Sinorhizobium meliloti]|uniref:helix-turn-helix domain-containing protein n=1 Tax=Rhizobium meliloti TaxID=382 RepID=UPI000B5A7686|nr:helix-turn-helix domain-containing protein [Sinorhizobium meliloti]ASJ59352.1 transcriptional regulator [Sinorhizobium meliloti]MCK3783110.1 helix-turn-helix domain-containing protein [Sinorhizobium meliloti]MCK3788260.1 helix-turn-helix domain-containing protein [Sinorhizobium meliloti]MCK3794463.1 helix-turn-helix domain-containing protein [Sinorhizobium meliloti]MDW9416447.1 helix-turn-helix domain-containing protein [Sinorhizobium meliloti]